ncbi:GFA family protein [Mesorhizobium sp. M0833]|uniref:GFA family protein n=1 Tax=Mesorhizobium sp. M0833 TaxID=2957009 RepID=UPI0033392477
MAEAQCLCGALKLTLREPSKLVVACHCVACQRRTAKPFIVGAFYPVNAVEISGEATEFVHCEDGLGGTKRPIQFTRCE